MGPHMTLQKCMKQLLPHILNSTGICYELPLGVKSKANSCFTKLDFVKAVWIKFYISIIVINNDISSPACIL